MLRRIACGRACPRKRGAPGSRGARSLPRPRLWCWPQSPQVPACCCGWGRGPTWLSRKWLTAMCFAPRGSPARCSIVGSAHGQALVSREAGFLSAGRRPRRHGLSAAGGTARLHSRSTGGGRRLWAPTAHHQCVHFVRMRGVRQQWRVPARFGDFMCITGRGTECRSGPCPI